MTCALIVRAQKFGVALPLANGVARSQPWVGCVIEKEGEMIGAGATQPPGHAHAEIEAIKSAGARARGATMYVTLEPCCHEGRTAPCTDAIIEAGIKKVVIWTEKHGGREAVFQVDQGDPFFNVNTPDDLKAAEAMV